MSAPSRHSPLAPLWEEYVSSRLYMGATREEIHGSSADGWWCGVIAALDVVDSGDIESVRSEVARQCAAAGGRDLPGGVFAS